LPGVIKGRQSSEPFRQRIFEHHHHGICSSTIARNKKLGAATVSRIYSQFTRRKANERLSLECPQYLGIDEHTLHKRQRFSTTLCDLRNHRIFDVRPGRSIADLSSYLLTLRGRHKVRVVCIDLSSPYRNIIRRFFPNARIVADRFHFVRIIYYHFMHLARAVAPQLKSYRGGLAAMRKRPSRLTPGQQQKLQQLFDQYPALKPIQRRAYGFRNLENYRLRVIAQCG
jgi:transposase